MQTLYKYPPLGLLLSRCPRTIQVSTGAVRGRGWGGMSHLDKREEGREGRGTNRIIGSRRQIYSVQIESVCTTRMNKNETFDNENKNIRYEKETWRIK